MVTVRLWLHGDFDLAYIHAAAERTAQSHCYLLLRFKSSTYCLSADLRHRTMAAERRQFFSKAGLDPFKVF